MSKSIIYKGSGLVTGFQNDSITTPAIKMRIQTSDNAKNDDNSSNESINNAGDISIGSGIGSHTNKNGQSGGSGGSTSITTGQGGDSNYADSNTVASISMGSSGNFIFPGFHEGEILTMTGHSQGSGAILYVNFVLYNGGVGYLYNNSIDAQNLGSNYTSELVTLTGAQSGKTVKGIINVSSGSLSNSGGPYITLKGAEGFTSGDVTTNEVSGDTNSFTVTVTDGYISAFSANTGSIQYNKYFENTIYSVTSGSNNHYFMITKNNSTSAGTGGEGGALTLACGIGGGGNTGGKGGSLTLLSGYGGSGATNGGSGGDITLESLGGGLGTGSSSYGSGGAIIFKTATQTFNTSERARITSDGYLRLSDFGSSGPSISGQYGGLWINTTNSPNELYFTNGSGGHVQITSGGSLAGGGGGGGGGVTLTGSTNDTICTVTGANAITGETNLTYNGSILDVTGYVKQSKGFTTLTATSTTSTVNNLTDLLVTFAVPSGAVITEVNYLVTKPIYVFYGGWTPLAFTGTSLDLKGGFTQGADELNLSSVDSVSNMGNLGNLVRPTLDLGRVGPILEGVTPTWTPSTFLVGANGKFSPSLSTSAYNSSIGNTNYIFTIKAASSGATQYTSLGGDPLLKTGLTFTASDDTWQTSGDNHGLSVGDEVNFTVSGGGATGSPGYTTGVRYYVKEIPTTLTSVGGNWNHSQFSGWSTQTDPGLVTGDIIQFTSNGGGLSSFSTNVNYYVTYQEPTILLSTSLINQINQVYIFENADSNSAWAASKVSTDLTKFKLSSTFDGSVVSSSQNSSNPWTATILFNYALTSLSFADADDVWTSTTEHYLIVNNEIEFLVSGGGATGSPGYTTGVRYFVTQIPDITTSVGNQWNYSNDTWFENNGEHLVFVTGDRIKFTSSGGGASAFSTNTIYYVNNNEGLLSLASSESNLSNGTYITGGTGTSGNWSAQRIVASTTQFKLSTTLGGSVLAGTNNSSSSWKAKIIASAGGGWTFTASSNTWTTGSTSGLVVGDKIKFIKSGGGATNYNLGVEYHIVSVSSNNIQLSTSSGGSVLVGSSNSSGYWQVIFVPQSEIKMSLSYLMM